MKRTISFILVLSMIIGCMTFLATGTSAYQEGDLDGNGKINAVDASLMSMLILGKGQQKKLAGLMGDVNLDNKVNSQDSNLLSMFFVGKYDIGDPTSRVYKIILNGENISEFVIENTDPQDECMKYAAEELQKHIGDACGVYPEIVNDKGNNKAITLLKDTTMVGMDAGVLEDEAYHMYTTDDGLTIEGGRYAGCLRGVYDFLYNYLGYRFYYKPNLEKYTPEDNAFRFVYEADEINLSAIDDTHYPAIKVRSTYGDTYMISPARHYNGERLFDNAKYGTWGITNKACHGVQNYFSEAEMNVKGWGYAYEKQPCYSNSLTIDTVKTRVMESLDRQVAAGAIPGKNLNYVDISHIDGFEESFCLCKTCRKIYAEEGNHAGAFLRFANTIDDAIQARPEYAGKIYTSILVYTGTIKAPKITKPNPMLVLSFCFYVASGVMECEKCSIGDASCPENSKNMEMFEEWEAFGNRIFAWYYPLEAYYYGGTSIYLFNCYEDIKYLAEHNVYGVFVCGTDDPYDSSFIMQAMLQRLMWNCDMTYEEYLDELREMFWLMYGEAGQYIYEYFEMIQQATDSTPEDVHPCGFHASPMRKLNMTYIKENADKIMELRETALSVATSKSNRTDIDKIFLHAIYLVCGATHTSRWLNGNEEQRAWYKNNLEYFVANAKKYKVQIASGPMGFEKVYVEPNREIDWDQNPFEWCLETLDTEGYGFGAYNWDYDY